MLLSDAEPDRRGERRHAAADQQRERQGKQRADVGRGAGEEVVDVEVDRRHQHEDGKPGHALQITAELLPEPFPPCRTG